MNGITKEQCLDLLQLLSAMESWFFSMGKPLPDNLRDQVLDATTLLRAEVLK